jgi:hypothetical protein
MNASNQTQAKFNIYHEFRESRNMPGKTVSVYIPTVHVRYTNSAICHVFNHLFGVVDRIDTVSIKSKDDAPSNFKAIFVHYFPTTPNDLIRDVEKNGSMRINPNVNTPYMNRYFWQPNAKVRNTEYWMILANKHFVPYTDLSLGVIELMMNDVEKQLCFEKEREALAANRKFFQELRAKENCEIPHYVDTSINVHQLVNNIMLMEARAEQDKEQRAFTVGATLLVENMKEDMLEPELWEQFSGVESLIAVKVCKNPANGKTLQYGYVHYETPEQASKAFKELEQNTTLRISRIL